MTDEHPIEREHASEHGRYVIHLPGGLEAEMTYRRLGPGTIAIDHTFSPPEFRGQNIAMRLLERALADARAENTRIVPVCSYVAAQFKRHPEWADLLVQ
jgi:predicted GNAT family acetyltransferase